MNNYLNKSRVLMDPLFEVDRIVSLGSNCEITANMREYYNIDTAYPFDWWITPLQSVKNLLLCKFTGLFDPNNIYVPDGRKTVVCRKFNILHHHDFLRDENDNVELEIEGQLEGLRSKFDFLAQRFFKDCSTGRTLFIRNRKVEDLHLAASENEKREDYEDLLRILCNLFPKAENKLLVTNVGRKESFLNGSLAFDEISYYGDCDDYRVSPKGWYELFDRQRVVIKRT